MDHTETAILTNGKNILMSAVCNFSTGKNNDINYLFCTANHRILWWRKSSTVDWLKIVSPQSFFSCHMVIQHRGADPNDIRNSHFSEQRARGRAASLLFLTACLRCRVFLLQANSFSPFLTSHILCSTQVKEVEKTQRPLPSSQYLHLAILFLHTKDIKGKRKGSLAFWKN